MSPSQAVPRPSPQIRSQPAQVRGPSSRTAFPHTQPDIDASSVDSSILDALDKQAGEAARGTAPIPGPNLESEPKEDEEDEEDLTLDKAELTRDENGILRSITTEIYHDLEVIIAPQENSYKREFPFEKLLSKNRDEAERLLLKAYWMIANYDSLDKEHKQMCIALAKTIRTRWFSYFQETIRDAEQIPEISKEEIEAPRGEGDPITKHALRLSDDNPDFRRRLVYSLTRDVILKKPNVHEWKNLLKDISTKHESIADVTDDDDDFTDADEFNETFEGTHLGEELLQERKAERKAAGYTQVGKTRALEVPGQPVAMNSSLVDEKGVVKGKVPKRSQWKNGSRTW